MYPPDCHPPAARDGSWIAEPSCEQGEIRRCEQVRRYISSAPAQRTVRLPRALKAESLGAQSPTSDPIQFRDAQRIHIGNRFLIMKQPVRRRKQDNRHLRQATNHQYNPANKGRDDESHDGDGLCDFRVRETVQSAFVARRPTANNALSYSLHPSKKIARHPGSQSQNNAKLIQIKRVDFDRSRHLYSAADGNPTPPARACPRVFRCAPDAAGSQQPSLSLSFRDASPGANTVLHTALSQRGPGIPPRQLRAATRPLSRDRQPRT